MKSLPLYESIYCFNISIKSSFLVYSFIMFYFVLSVNLLIISLLFGSFLSSLLKIFLSFYSLLDDGIFVKL